MKLKKLGNIGDTIIEVLVVLAILGLAFAISSATASRGLTQSRNAEEHSEALGILSSQVEILRAAVAKGTSDIFTRTADQPFCLVDADTVKDSSAPECKKDFYSSSIKNTNGYFDMRVNWDGIGSLGPQQENFVYRIRELGADSTNGNPTGNSVGKIQINVLRLKAGAACGSSNPADIDADLGGSSVTLNQVSGGSAVYNDSNMSGAFTIFQPLNDNTSWKGRLNSVPGGYERCFYPGTSDYVSDTKLLVPGNNQQSITFQMRPIPIPDWTVPGGSYNYCVSTDIVYNDGYDGCFKLTDASGRTSGMYLRRMSKFRYQLGFPTTIARSAKLTINYNQYRAAGTRPPAGYTAFTLQVRFGTTGPDSFDSRPAWNMTIEPQSDASWTARDATLNVDIPANVTTLELQWMNNNGGDPDLQINTVKIGS